MLQDTGSLRDVPGILLVFGRGVGTTPFSQTLGPFWGNPYKNDNNDNVEGAHPFKNKDKADRHSELSATSLTRQEEIVPNNLTDVKMDGPRQLRIWGLGFGVGA